MIQHPGSSVTSGRRGPSRLRGTAAAIALLAMVLAAYVPALRAGFIWDDNDHITGNPTLRSLDGLRRIWFEIGAVPQYYPAVHTTFWLEYHLWGLAPAGYHLDNLLLHALNAVLLWQLLKRLGVPGAWGAGAILALHPVYVESVAWVTERKNVLSGAFYLGAALAWLRFRPLCGGAPDGTRSRRGYVALIVLFLCAVLSKTVTATLPAALLVLVWWRRGRITGGDVAPLAPLFAIGMGMGLLTAWMERHHVGAMGRAWDLTFVERLLIAGRAVWFYAAKLFWPYPLAFIYPRWNVNASAAWQYVFPAAAVAVPCLLWKVRNRLGRAPLAGVLYFGGTLFPALGFFNVYPMRYSFVADHFQYLASLGIVIPAVALAAGRFQRLGPSRRWAGPAIAGILLLGMGTLTLRQSSVYADLETLWRDTLTKNPRAYPAHNNLGALLLARGDTRGAREHFEEATRIEPDSPEAYDNLGIILHNESRYDEAIVRYRKALQLEPIFADAHNNLGITLATVGRIDEAVSHFRDAIRYRPSFAKAHYNLGVALLRLGQKEEAMARLSEAVRLAPDDSEARRTLQEARELDGERGTRRE